MKAMQLAINLVEQISGNWIPKAEGNVIWMERKIETRTEFVHFPTMRTHEGFRFFGELICNTAFGEVEKLLEPYYKRYEIEFLHRTIIHSSVRQAGIDEIKIDKKDDLVNVKFWINSTLANEVLPFFNLFHSVKDVHNKIIAMDKSEWSSFVYPPVPIKIFVIKGLLGTEDFQSYSDWIIETYTKISKGKEDKIEGKSLKIMLELKDYFKN